MSETVIPKIKSSEFNEMAEPMALDLTAVFTLMKEETMGLIRKAAKEGWTTEVLIKEIENLI